MEQVDPVLAAGVAVVAFVAGVLVGRGLRKLLFALLVAAVLAALGWLVYQRLAPKDEPGRAAWEESGRRLKEKASEAAGEVKEKAAELLGRARDADKGEPKEGAGEDEAGR